MADRVEGNALPYSPGGFVPYLLSLPEVASVWEQHVRHPFTLSLGDGTLPMASFRRYLIQDYHFLTHYARAVCVLASKAPSVDDVFAQAAHAADVREEMELHVAYCSGLGLSVSDMQAVPEHPACTAYVDFLARVAQEQDWMALQVALSPCMLGYKAVGQFLLGWEGSRPGSNPYWSWVEQYSGTVYAEAVDESLKLLEKYAALEQPERVEGLVRLFMQAAQLEIAFWDMGMEPGSEADPHDQDVRDIQDIQHTLAKTG